MQHGDHSHEHMVIRRGDPCYTAAAQPVAPVDAWIDPDGGFHPVPPHGHEAWAEEFHNTWTLETRGWVHLTGGSIIHKRPVSQPQIDTLFDTLTVYRHELPADVQFVADRLENQFNMVLNATLEAAL